MKITARILHGSGVHFRVLFVLFPVLSRNMEQRKPMKTNAFNDRPRGVSSLDLGRTVQAVSAPFLFICQMFATIPPMRAEWSLHGFCTLLRRFHSSAPTSYLRRGR